MLCGWVLEKLGALVNLIFTRSCYNNSSSSGDDGEDHENLGHCTKTTLKDATQLFCKSFIISFVAVDSHIYF